MSWKEIVAASILFGAACPVFALQAVPEPQQGAPEAPANARYCLRVEAPTGTRLETVQCWTRSEWAEMDVDVETDWAEEGVRIIS